MPATICPTVTAEAAPEYEAQMQRVSAFAGRLHIDVADGQLAPRRLVALDQLWWPGNKVVDLHVMYRRPFDHTELFVVQHPNMVIIHAEAEGNFLPFAQKMHEHGIEVGVALLPQTPVSAIAPAISMIDHALVFSGNLGYQGGSKADFNLLAKVKQLRKLKPALEIGWDGGVNADNVRRLAAGGVDVLNVGGFIQSARNPSLAFRQLVAETSLA